MKNITNLLLGAALLSWELFNKKARWKDMLPQKIEHGVTIRTPDNSNQNWEKRRERHIKRAIRRVAGRGTMRVKGHKPGSETPGPNKFWSRAQLERVGLSKGRTQLPGGRRETYLVATRGNRVLQIPNYGSIVTKAA